MECVLRFSAYQGTCRRKPFFIAYLFDVDAVIRLIGPGPADHGQAKGRVPSQSPSWHTGSSQNQIVMLMISPIAGLI